MDFLGAKTMELVHENLEVGDVNEDMDILTMDTELFNGVKNDRTQIIVECIVTDIDDIVKIVRFDGGQTTTTGKQEVKKALRSVVWMKYKIKDKEVFDKAYSYIEQYY